MLRVELLGESEVPGAEGLEQHLESFAHETVRERRVVSGRGLIGHLSHRGRRRKNARKQDEDRSAGHSATSFGKTGTRER